MTIKLNGKRTTKAEAIKMYGKEKIEQRIKNAKQDYNEDPNTEISWMDGMSIEF